MTVTVDTNIFMMTVIPDANRLTIVDKLTGEGVTCPIDQLLKKMLKQSRNYAKRTKNLATINRRKASQE